MVPSPLPPFPVSLASVDTTDSRSGTPSIDEATVYDLLGNERRRACLKRLVETEGERSVSDLSEEVAEMVADTSTSPDEIYNSVYISLYQTHLTQLDDAGLVDYNQEEKAITLGPAFDELEQYWLTAEEPDNSSPGVQQRLLVSSVVILLCVTGAIVSFQLFGTLAFVFLLALNLGVIGTELLERRYF